MPPTKLQEEARAATDAVYRFKDHIDASAPTTLKGWINTVMYHPGTPYFLMGMAIEGLGLAVMQAFSMPILPIGDAILGFIAGYLIMWKQIKREKRAE